MSEENNTETKAKPLTFNERYSKEDRTAIKAFLSGLYKAENFKWESTFVKKHLPEILEKYVLQLLPKYEGLRNFAFDTQKYKNYTEKFIMKSKKTKTKTSTKVKVKPTFDDSDSESEEEVPEVKEETPEAKESNKTAYTSVNKNVRAMLWSLFVRYVSEAVLAQNTMATNDELDFDHNDDEKLNEFLINNHNMDPNVSRYISEIVVGTRGRYLSVDDDHNLAHKIGEAVAVHITNPSLRRLVGNRFTEFMKILASKVAVRLSVTRSSINRDIFITALLDLETSVRMPHQCLVLSRLIDMDQILYPPSAKTSNDDDSEKSDKPAKKKGKKNKDKNEAEAPDETSKDESDKDKSKKKKKSKKSKKKEPEPEPASDSDN